MRLVAKPVEVQVPPPGGAPFPTIHHRLTCPADADAKVRNLLAWIKELEAVEHPNSTQVMKIAHWWAAVAALRAGKLEIDRRERATTIEESWWGPLPQWPGPGR